MSVVKKKYYKILSAMLCGIFFCFVSIVNFPFLHNLAADCNVLSTKNFVILKGGQHHKKSPNLPCIPCFEFSDIEVIDISYCPICQIFNNNRFILLSQPVNFYYRLNSLVNHPLNSLIFISNIAKTSSSRAPPLA